MSSPSSVESVSKIPPVAIVGAGAVGTALARRLVAVGGSVAAVISRRSDAADALADRVRAPVASDDVLALPTTARLVVLCVPDDAIVDVATALAAVDHPWGQTVVGHTSGARTAADLAPLAERGAATCSLHPMQTFPDDAEPSAFEGIVIGLQGMDDALEMGEILARRLGGTPVRLSASDKTQYHCAAALASNGLVALMAAVRDVLATAGIDTETARQLVRPLVRQTLANLEQDDPEAVLTGPAARGDLGTVRAHLHALSGSTPHLVPLYADLTEEMVRLAVRDGRLEPDSAAPLRALLATARSS
jgi:predicted short-subunit dehydrogenase-like oxidoreductase (DUF2520 family)